MKLLFVNLNGNTFKVIREASDLDADAFYVEYVGEMPNEEPFTLQTPNGQEKFQYVKAKYPSGKEDIGVYAFRGDMTYGYQAFRKLHNINESVDNTNPLVLFKKKLYAELEKAGFHKEGQQPREYMEYYAYNFATVQVSVNVEEGTLYLERYYDNERFDDKNWHKTVPIQNTDEWLKKAVATAVKMKENIRGDASILGGDDTDL